MSNPTPRVRVRNHPQSRFDDVPSHAAEQRRNTPAQTLRLETWPIERLRAPANVLRNPGKSQAEKLEASVSRFGFTVPVICTSDGEIIDGAKRFKAAQSLGYASLPVAIVDGLSSAEIQALRISISKLAELSAWDPAALSDAFKGLLDVDPSLLRVTGFEMAEIDALLFKKLAPSAAGETPPAAATTPISQRGDLFTIGPHRLLCGDAKDPVSYEKLLRTDTCQMVLADVPYGVKISGTCSRSHGEFLEGSDCDESEMATFFSEFLAAVNGYLPPGCIVDLFIDHRNICALTLASRSIDLEHVTTCVWDKQSGGMGGLYRNQAEYVLILKKRGAAFINNVKLGAHGRNRTTVWSHPGYAAFGAERQEAIERHPTSKPVGLLADAILDVSKVGGVVLDMFAGSGSTLVAAHRVQRVGMGIEIDPRFVDVSVKRLEEAVGEAAVHEATGLTFAELSAQRTSKTEAE